MLHALLDTAGYKVGQAYVPESSDMKKHEITHLCSRQRYAPEYSDDPVFYGVIGLVAGLISGFFSFLSVDARNTAGTIGTAITAAVFGIAFMVCFIAMCGYAKGSISNYRIDHAQPKYGRIELSDSRWKALDQAFSVTGEERLSVLEARSRMLDALASDTPFGRQIDQIVSRYMEHTSQLAVMIKNGFENDSDLKLATDKLAETAGRAARTIKQAIDLYDAPRKQIELTFEQEKAIEAAGQQEAQRFLSESNRILKTIDLQSALFKADNFVEG